MTTILPVAKTAPPAPRNILVGWRASDNSKAHDVYASVNIDPFNDEVNLDRGNIYYVDRKPVGVGTITSAPLEDHATSAQRLVAAIERSEMKKLPSKRVPRSDDPDFPLERLFDIADGSRLQQRAAMVLLVSPNNKTYQRFGGPVDQLPEGIRNVLDAAIGVHNSVARRPWSWT